MNEIRRINHVGLRIRSLKPAQRFYEKLGFKFVAGPIGPEPVAVMEHPNGITLNFILNASTECAPVNLLMDVNAKHTGFTHIALEVNDLDAAERTIHAAGLTITDSVQIPRGARFFFVRDPDDNVVEFHQPA